MESNSASQSPFNIHLPLGQCSSQSQVSVVTQDDCKDSPSQYHHFDLENLTGTLQAKITTSVKEVIAQTLDSMRNHFEKEIRTLVKRVESLTLKVRVLEQMITPPITKRFCYSLTNHSL